MKRSVASHPKRAAPLVSALGIFHHQGAILSRASLDKDARIERDIGARHAAIGV
jgi:hypothetical protein